MFIKTWNVLLVDDEPDVLRLSKLVMKDFAVHGVPIKSIRRKVKPTPWRSSKASRGLSGGFLSP
ncbi:MAG: hypothetical protein GY759_24840 [Chloroflexi bacterium]|nr:hypothetical protein [Chloroflexota bacterium]